MRQRLIHNFIPARAQAILVTLLYVFLCTFGTLTHVHAPGDSHTGHQANRMAASSRLKSGLNATPPVLSAPSHCAFCDWEANSLARTIAVWQMAVPLTFACHYHHQSTPLSPVFVVHSSSRAPPAA